MFGFRWVSSLSFVPLCCGIRELRAWVYSVNIHTVDRSPVMHFNEISIHTRTHIHIQRDV